MIEIKENISNKCLDHTKDIETLKKEIEFFKEQILIKTKHIYALEFSISTLISLELEDYNKIEGTNISLENITINDNYKMITIKK